MQTSLTAIEWAIVRHENTIEDCWMQEEEALQEEEDTDAEMEEEGERGDGEPSGPQGAAETEDAPPPVPIGDAIVIVSVHLSSFIINFA